MAKRERMYQTIARLEREKAEKLKKEAEKKIEKSKLN